MKIPEFLGAGDFVYAQPGPVIIASAGVTLVARDGRRYIDGTAANGTTSLGYDRTILEEAMVRAARLPSCPVFLETEARLDLAARLEKFVQEALGVRGRISFELGGAQAIELAMRICRANTGSGQFVVFEGGYHGRSGMTAQLSASHRYRKAHGEWRLPVHRLPSPDCARCRFSQVRETCHHECVTFLRTSFDGELGGLLSRDGGRELSGLVFEPIQNTAGMVRPDDAYLQAAISAVRARGGLIVADETFTGFYRTGPRLASQRLGVVPDLVVLGKAFSNGCVPLSCVWARSDLTAPDAFPPGSHSATFIHNALSMAVGLTVLDRYATPPDVGALERKLRTGVAEAVHGIALVESTMVSGGCVRIALRRPVAAHVRALSLDGPEVDGYSGLVLAVSGLLPDVIGLSPPFVITDSELSALFAHLRRALTLVRA